MKSWPLATLHLILGSAFLFVKKLRQRRQISACHQGTGPYASEAEKCFLSIKFVSWTEIFVTFTGFWQRQGRMLAHNLAHSPPVPDDPFSITITAASKKSCMHSPIMYQTDLLISKRKRSARAMRSISCLCSSNRSVSLFSGTNFSS